jgi:ADP-ribose pyrophosphatase YjhB (NUDIX family)
MTQQTSNDKPPVAAAIITNDGHVLLVRRRVSEGTLSWQFPAGDKLNLARPPRKPRSAKQKKK